MRLRIVRRPTESRIDGIRLDHFRVGDQYEVGTALGAVFLAEGWAVPVPDDVPVPARGVEYQASTTPPNLIRESYRPTTRNASAAVPQTTAQRQTISGAAGGANQASTRRRPLTVTRTVSTPRNAGPSMGSAPSTVEAPSAEQSSRTETDNHDVTKDTKTGMSFVDHRERRDGSTFRLGSTSK
jgi:hypothetical protein